MKLKDKIKSYSFWVSLASAIILILKILGNRFGFTVDETMVSDLFTALCSILVLLGIIVPPQNTQNSTITVKKKQSNKFDLISENSLQNSTSCEEIKNTNNPEYPEQNTTKQEEVISDNNIEVYSIKQEPKTNIEDDKLDNQKPVEIIEASMQDNDTTNHSLQESQNIEEDNNDKTDFKQMFFDIKEKFSGNLDLYIFELQEEIRKTREGM